MFHNDRGSQYTSKRYRKWLANYDMKANMADVDAYWDNTVVERFFDGLKSDGLLTGAKNKA